MALKYFNTTEPEIDLDDDEMFLSAIPLELLEEAIKKQFDDPLEYRKSDYVKSFLNKYYFSVREMYEEEEEDINQIRDEFISFMEKMFFKYLGIGMPGLDDKSDDDQNEMVHKIYRYFIMQIKKNITNLIWYYITHDQGDMYQVLDKKENIIYNNFKKEIDDEKDILILSNLPDVIDYVLTLDISVDRFFEATITDTSSMEAIYVRDCYVAYELNGDFVGSYLTMVDNYFKVELESKIKKRILNKYPKRKNAGSVIDIEEKDIDNTDADNNNSDTDEN